MRHSAAWWAKRVEELEASGDAGAVARRHGVKVGTLAWWRSELRRRGGAQVRGRGPRLLPVVVADDASAIAGERSEELELVVEALDARVTLRGRFSPSFIVSVLRASAARC